jgi:glyoxylase-like metal-dependent hydrolase (beta-lactamase superfamily II)
MDDALTGSLIKEGMIDQKHRRPPLSENRIAVDRVIQEGDAIEVDDGVSFQVLQTPGHSDCSLSFFEPDRKVLILSDATGYYMPEHDCWWANYFVDYGAYLSSIERLAGLGAEVLCLSHNAVIRGGDEAASYFERVLQATKDYHQRIVDEAKSGKSVREIAEALGSEVYEKKPLFPLDFFQKNCGILVKVSLRHEGIDY